MCERVGVVNRRWGSERRAMNGGWSVSDYNICVISYIETRDA